MADQDILIRILTAYEGGGINAAKQAAADLAKEVKAGTPAAQELAAVNQVLSLRAGAAAGAMNGLVRAMQGGPGAAQGLMQTITALSGSLGALAGPAGLIAVVGLGVAAMWTKWQQGAELAAKKAEEAKQELEEINRTRQEEVTAQVASLRSELDRADAAARKLRDTLAATEDAKLQLAFAQIDRGVAEGGISREEGEERKAALRLSAEQIRIDRELADIAKARAESVAAEAEARAEAARQAEVQKRLQEIARKDAFDLTEEDRATLGLPPRRRQDGGLEQEEIEQANAAKYRARQVGSRQAEDAASVADRVAREQAEKRQDLGSREEVLGFRRAALETRAGTGDILTRRRQEEDEARRQAEQAAAAEQAAKEAAKAEEARGPSRSRALGAVRRGYRGPAGETADGPIADRTQQLGQQAVARAAAVVRGGADLEQTMQQLLAYLEQIGAVLASLPALKTELEKVQRAGENDRRVRRSAP
jgi:hypothetical protein